MNLVNPVVITPFIGGEQKKPRITPFIIRPFIGDPPTPFGTIGLGGPSC